MRPITMSVTGVGRSNIGAADSMKNPFVIGFAATLTGTATYNIELSMDDPMIAAPTVWGAPEGKSGLTASLVGRIDTPCHAISVNITSGTGTVTLQYIQAGDR